MDALLNIDLWLVGLAVAGAGMLGFSIYFSDPRSATAKTFLFYTLVTVGWSLANYASYQTYDSNLILWFIRAVLFFATWHAFSFFLLALQFPRSDFVLKPVIFGASLAWTSLVSLLVLTPFVYQGVTAVEPAITTETGPGIAIFGMTVVFFVLAGIIALARKLLHAKGDERNRLDFVFIGVVTTFTLLLALAFVLPAFFNTPDLVPLGGLFQLPLIIGTAYAILRYRLFNLRVAIVGLLTFFLAATVFFDILFSGTAQAVLLRSVELLLMLVFGIWLIKSVVKEIRLREKVEAQEKELQEANKEQESLLHFMSHEVKGYFTESEAGFAAIADGDLGKVPNAVRSTAETALSGVRRGVAMVMEILDAANFKKGTVMYKQEMFDFRAAIRDVVEKLQTEADKKGLAIEAKVGEGHFNFQGDEEKLKQHVIRNLLDNAIKYSPSGTICATLTDGETIRFSVKDTGVGITQEDMHQLFTEGGKGKDSIKVNVHSTGYGLFIAKKIVEAHGGRIWAESEGEGKGSTFIVEFPATL